MGLSKRPSSGLDPNTRTYRNMKARRPSWWVRTIRTVLAALGPGLLVIGVVGAAGSAVVNFIVYDEHDKYGEVPIPGEGSVHLPVRTATIYFRAHSDKFGDDEGIPLPDGVEMTLIPPDGIAQPDISTDHSGVSSTNNNGWVSLWKAKIVIEGDYRVVTDADTRGFDNSRLAFGRDSEYWWITWLFFKATIVGVIIAFLAWLAGEIRNRLRSRWLYRS